MIPDQRLTSLSYLPITSLLFSYQGCIPPGSIFLRVCSGRISSFRYRAHKTIAFFAHMLPAPCACIIFALHRFAEVNDDIRLIYSFSAPQSDSVFMVIIPRCFFLDISFQRPDLNFFSQKFSARWGTGLLYILKTNDFSSCVFFSASFYDGFSYLYLGIPDDPRGLGYQLALHSYFDPYHSQGIIPNAICILVIMGGEKK